MIYGQTDLSTYISNSLIQTITLLINTNYSLLTGEKSFADTSCIIYRYIIIIIIIITIYNYNNYMYAWESIKIVLYLTSMYP